MFLIPSELTNSVKDEFELVCSSYMFDNIMVEFDHQKPRRTTFG